MGVSILKMGARKPGSAHVTLSTQKHPVEVGMTGVVVSLDARVEIIGVSPGRAEAIVTGRGVEKLWLRGFMILLEPTSVVRSANEAVSRGSGGSSDTGGHPR